MLFIFPPVCSPTHSTRLLWRGCSPGTPNTDASLETPSMPDRLHFSEEKRGRKGWRKGENSLVPGCIFLSLWFPSTVNVNKQRHERGKHGQNGEKKSKRGRKKREETVSRQNISWHEAWDTSHQLIYWYHCQTLRQKTHAGNKSWLPDTPAQGGLSLKSMTNFWHTSILTLWTTAAGQRFRIWWFKWFSHDGVVTQSGNLVIKIL